MSDETSNPGGPAPQPPAEGKKPGSTTVAHGTLIMGTYEIESLINSGGMGEVYRGRNIHNDEPVAIKIVLPSLAHDPKIVALFQKESTVLSRLSHEAIVRYHVFTNDPTIGRPCMVMEFVSGQALSDRIEQGAMPTEDVRVMLRRVAAGLDKAHRAGVVHRDLSPDNVILEGGSVEHAKLIDFGIAKSSSFGSGTLLQGQFAGKFNWVAPEQLGAFGGVVDGRSDIYSLALITAAASRGEVLQMGASIVDAVGKRASVPDLTGVDPALQPLLGWMLQPDPAARAPSMAEVIRALDNPSIIPGPPPPPAPDPNRTVIGGALPGFADLPPVPTAPPAAPRPVTAPPPAAATVIAASGPAQEPDDSSPFGAPPKAAPAARPAPAPAAPAPAKSGKGGMIAAAVVVLAGLGGGGAYLSGVFGPSPAPQVAEPAPEEKAANEAKLAEEKAAADAKAAEEKAAADAKAAEEARLAEAKAAADKAAADAAAKAAEEARLAEEKAAAEKAAAAAAEAADPVAKQARFFEAIRLPPCSLLSVTEARAEGFRLAGLAADAAPLNALAEDWAKATGQKPDLALASAGAAHCPAIDFAAALPRSEGTAPALALEGGEAQKSGVEIRGTITGTGDRPLSLFLVSEAGGVSELSRFVTSEGTDARFSFMLTLDAGAPAGRQLLVALASDDALAAALQGLPEGADAGQVFGFLSNAAPEVEGGALAALLPFTLEP